MRRSPWMLIHAHGFGSNWSRLWLAGLSALLLAAPARSQPSPYGSGTPAPPPLPPATTPAPAPGGVGAATMGFDTAGPPAPANSNTLPLSPPSGPVSMVPMPTGLPVPQPHYPTVDQRSGLIGRFTPIEPRLPHDCRRDTFYDTRWTDCPDNHPNHPNTIKGGGLYGRRWPGYCTASFTPYFYGSPGESTVGAGCKPWHRMLKLPQTLLQPFRPVCYYYDQGSYVPVYDLDPLVPGPGPNPYFFPFYLACPRGG